MEGNKLDLTGDREEKQPLASYKAIPEADMEEELITSPKAVIKVKNYSGADGADEKMLSDEESKFNSSNVDISDHKVIIKEKNGEAKLDIGELKAAFAGMGKEELMKYANDPFWVKLRWFLFVLFWLLWLAMLLGAAAIIYTAPKCDPPAPRPWWEEGPLTELRPDFNPEQLEELKSSGIRGFIVDWREDSYAEINDAHNVISLLKKGKETNIPIILDLEASMSNVWFQNSENKVNYEDYYIWRKTDAVEGEPPNNWISRKNESSWKYSAVRKEYYYAPENWPQLNFRNENVTEEFIKVLRRFADKGAKGFRIRDAHILLVDPHFENQPLDPTNEKGYNLKEYGFYIHSKTEHSMDLGPLLKNWRTVVKNITDNGPFMVKNPLEKIEAYKVNTVLVVDLPSQSNVFNKPVFEPEKVVHALDHVFKTQRLEWPLWTHKSAALPADVLDSVTYLLPGVALVDGSASVNKELDKIRESPSAIRGEVKYQTVANNTVLAFTRLAPGSPGLLIAVNPTNNTVTVNFERDMEQVSSEVTVQFTSKNFNETDCDIGLKKKSTSIPISARSSIVLSYTPKKVG